MMTALETSVYQTILYLDIYDFAPSLTELYRYLLNSQQPTTLAELSRIVTDNPAYTTSHGFIALHDSAGIIARRTESYVLTEHKIARDRWIIQILSALPGVRGIWLCNTLGWGNTRKHSDMDMCIVATRGHVWTVRLLTTAVLKILRRRPGECSRERAICPSFYIDDSCNDLGIHKLSSDDIHFAFWITQMTPLYNTTLFNRWAMEQQWARSFFAHDPFLLPTQRRAITLSPVIELCKQYALKLFPEQLLKKLQLRYLPKEIRAGSRAGVVVLNDAILKLHTHDTRAAIRDRFFASCRAHHVSDSLHSRSVT